MNQQKQRSQKRAVPLDERREVDYDCDVGYKRPYYTSEDGMILPVTNMFDVNGNPTNLPTAAASAVMLKNTGFQVIFFTDEEEHVEYESIH